MTMQTDTTTLYFYEGEADYLYWIVGPQGTGPVLRTNDEGMSARSEAAKSLNIEVRRTGEIPNTPAGMEEN